jgi:hypothetical protein
MAPLASLRIDREKLVIEVWREDFALFVDPA